MTILKISLNVSMVSTSASRSRSARSASVSGDRVMIHPPADRPGQGATLFPIENDRWIVTLTDAVRPYRGTANRRRYFERGSRPDSFLVMGDALTAVSPVHWHGMSVAALSVLRLSAELARHGAEPAVLPRVQLAVAAEADRSWRMATDQDRPPTRAASGAERLARTALSRALLSSPALMTEFFRTQTLMSSPPAVDPARPPGRPEPLLTADEAIAQYPGLSAWWLSGHVGESRDTSSRPVDSPRHPVRQSGVPRAGDHARRQPPGLPGAGRRRTERVGGPAGPAARGDGRDPRPGAWHPHVLPLPRRPHAALPARRERRRELAPVPARPGDRARRPDPTAA